MCFELGCKTRPNFNLKGQPKGLYCVKHKTLDMVDVNHKTCIEPDCKIRPNYNTAGDPIALYCVKHKKIGMIDVKNKTCMEPNCKTIPIFNFEGEPKAEYCVEHKKIGMINVKNKTCMEPNCKIRPHYNMENEPYALYCSEHKLNGMINVKSKTCIHPNCRTIPNYNFEGEPYALYCAEHKLNGMINVISKTCIHPNCRTIPIFNTKGKKAEYCLKHKSLEMIDVKNKNCKTYLCYTQVQDKYDGYCLYCFIHIFPDKPVAKNYKTKEFAVVEHIKNKYPELSWREDEKVQDGCSKRRPDLLLDLGYQIVIIEIDENQHIDYDCSCENKRMMELSKDLGHRPIIFIRFNPDDYVSEENTVSSCWGNNKNGICVVKKTKQKEWTERLIALENQINYWNNSANITDKTIEIIQLFYDV
jgi:hypothetical protein